MKKRYSKIIFSILLGTLLVNCAKRSTPSGGEIDVTPPKIKKSTPENYSTNFSSNKIRIDFDEYVKIKALQKQLVISPPMNTPPEITPLGGASKSVTIKLFDTLQPNTTYAINFGESIVDNNEENPYPFYRYVFSTGAYIDSLSLKGDIVDALEKYTDDFVSVLLHEIDSTFKDSIVYHKKPKYITNTLDSTTAFKLNNLKAGTYLLTALKEPNNNYIFDPKTDKIGFVNKRITLPADTSKHFTIKLFKEILEFKVLRASYLSEHKIAFAYEGNPKHTKIKILSNTPTNFEYTITKATDKDSLNYWYKPKIDLDSLLFEVSNRDYKDTLLVRLPKREKDTLMFSEISDRTLRLDDNFKLSSTSPITKIDDSKISIIDKDSVAIPHTTTLDKYTNIAEFSFPKKEDNRYRLRVLPGAFTDFYGEQNDTINYTVTTRPLISYGSVRVNITNGVYPMIVQLTDEGGVVKAEKYISENNAVDFAYLTPNKYYLRVIIDANKNGIYDTGNYLLKQQPEKVYHAVESVDVKAYFDQIIAFPLAKDSEE